MHQAVAAFVTAGPNRCSHACISTGLKSYCSANFSSVSRQIFALLQDGVETLVPTGPYNIAFSRTPAEVLAIVYLGSASTPGGFFPAGVNGAIQG